jgi:Coenzyme F420-dependent N5,N10-methylene tetrahydromethanopterin reductase and related flavin-dependent oxidoreductases
MKFRVFTEPQQGASYEQLLSVAREAETLGFDAFFRSDHFLKMGEVSGLPGPTDAWATLAGLARETRRIRLGTLLTSATFRLPGHLAITVAQIDHMSSGRIELGIGAGWYEQEHRAYGIPFPPRNERFNRLEEQLAIVTGLWKTPSEQSFSYQGRYYQLENSPGLPKPYQRPYPPIIVGGSGPTRTPRLAARFADEYNIPFPSLDDFLQLQKAADRACTEENRDPASLTRSVALVVCCGRNEQEFKRRATAIHRDPIELRAVGIAGLVSEAVEKLDAFRRAGATTVYLQLLDLGDLEHLQLLAAEVMPHLEP